MRSISKVFLDANVLFDLCITDRPFHEDSVKAVEFLLVNGAELYTSSDFVTTIYYVLSRVLKDRDKVLDLIEDMVSYTMLVGFSNEEVVEAIKLMKRDKNFRDLEDTLVYVLAKKEGCDLILSNDKDFYSPDVRVMSSEEFCETFCE